MAIQARKWWVPCLLMASLTAQQQPLSMAEESTALLLRQLVREYGPALATTNRLDLDWLRFRSQQRNATLHCGGYAIVLHNNTTGVPGEGFVLYAWSERRNNRNLVLAQGGTVLATPGPGGYQEPKWDAALPADAPQDLGGILRSPGRSADGRLWTAVDEVANCAISFAVRDRAGRPWTEGQVVLAPLHWAYACGLSSSLLLEDVPIGHAELDEDGKVELRGPRARGVLVGVRVGTIFAPHVGLRVRDDLFELVVDRQEILGLRMGQNETTAADVLKRICSAQKYFKATGALDIDGNGVGEHAFFTELAGISALRVSAKGGVGQRKLDPPALDLGQYRIDQGRFVAGGYVFEIFLPGKDGTWVSGADDGSGQGVAVDPAQAEKRWCCGAWPLSYGMTGRRAFFVTEGGDIFCTWNRDGQYEGHAKPMPPTAPRVGEGLAAPPAVNQAGNDGQEWHVRG